MAGPGRKPTVSDAEILNAFRETPDPVLTTNEVAEVIELSRRGTFDRLARLSEDGEIKMKKIRETGAIWWFPDALAEMYSSKQNTLSYLPDLPGPCGCACAVQ